jgi:general L-amino acid transport system permease protein
MTMHADAWTRWRDPKTWAQAAYDPHVRAVVFQVLVVVALALLATEIALNTAANLKQQNIASGFGFLSRTSGFDISQTLVPYSSKSSYGQAFLVGLANTLLVAGLGIVLATALGFSIGIARLSPNWIVAKLALVYVELIRNVPLLLQLLVWYVAVLRALPAPQDSAAFLGGAHFDVRGLHLPWLSLNEGLAFPTLGRFNYEGGLTVEPEFLALLIGLSTYTAAFIAEIVRSGLTGVPKGQSEAAAALGLKRRQALRFVILPQALRIIIPPLTNQYLNLTKNSSLAVAIGYPDLVSVFSGTVLNQTGQAVEVIAITMAVYLAISLATALFMGWFNARTAWAER